MPTGSLECACFSRPAGHPDLAHDGVQKVIAIGPLANNLLAGIDESLLGAGQSRN